jgi:hypothetical protein
MLAFLGLLGSGRTKGFKMSEMEMKWSNYGISWTVSLT